jgi:hypothetical protein
MRQTSLGLLLRCVLADEIRVWDQMQSHGVRDRVITPVKVRVRLGLGLGLTLGLGIGLGRVRARIDGYDYG